MSDNLAKQESPQTGARLIGWLVSYALDARGRYFELRSGRILVGSEKGQDRGVIALREETISAPHLALSASPKHRIMAQDIFSAHGSYITRAGSNEEKPISGPIELGHGDWIRIGKNTRLQVCLIDGPSR